MENRDRMKIIIADDHLLFADGLEQIISSMPKFEVIAKVTDGKMLLQKLNSTQPDMILLDINMPYLNGLEAAAHIRRTRPMVKIVFLSMYSDTKIIAAARHCNAMGFIMKDVTAPLLKDALIDINNNIPVFLLPGVRQAEADPVAPQDDFISKYKITGRELEIINLIKQGKANKQIAFELELSAYTIETHRKNIYRKLKVQSVAELIKRITTLWDVS